LKINRIIGFVIYLLNYPRKCSDIVTIFCEYWQTFFISVISSNTDTFL